MISEPGERCVRVSHPRGAVAWHRRLRADDTGHDERSLHRRLVPDRAALYPQGLFHRALARERSLTMRFGHCFSLLELELKDGNVDSREARVLAHHVSRRIRETDIAGWLTDTCVGVILSDTSPPHAWCLASAISAAVSPEHVHVRCRVDSCTPPGQDDGTPSPESREMEVPEVDTILFEHQPVWKRIMDVLLASMALVILAPIFLVTAVLIKLVSPGPVFFKQQRIGLLGRPFSCWKFRSMRVGADQGVHQAYMHALQNSHEALTKLETTGSDDRLIPLGRLFRASGLDELPQLINVLRGQMSVVGPRPCLPYEFAACFPWQRDRFVTPPGLTGLWQVSGKNKTTFEQMMRLDVQYAKHRSFWMDLRVVCTTPLVVVSQLVECILPRPTAVPEQECARDGKSQEAGDE